MVFLRTDINGDQGVLRRSFLRFAPRDQIRPWSPNGVLDHISDKCRKHDAYGKSQYSDVGFVDSRLNQDSP